MANNVATTSTYGGGGGTTELHHPRHDDYVRRRSQATLMTTRATFSYADEPWYAEEMRALVRHIPVHHHHHHHRFADVPGSFATYGGTGGGAATTRATRAAKKAARAARAARAADIEEARRAARRHPYDAASWFAIDLRRMTETLNRVAPGDHPMVRMSRSSAVYQRSSTPDDHRYRYRMALAAGAVPPPPPPPAVVTGAASLVLRPPAPSHHHDHHHIHHIHHTNHQPPPPPQTSLVDLVHRLGTMRHLAASIRHRCCESVHALPRLQTTARLAHTLIDLRTRVRAMDVSVVSSSSVEFFLDLLKFAVPKKPACSSMVVVRRCLSRWVCRRRFLRHRSGAASYPLHRVRYREATRRASLFTWVNPRHKRRWASLQSAEYSLPPRVPNMAACGRAPPDESGWIHRYLTGALRTTAALSAKRAEAHASAARAYRAHYAARDWAALAQTAWKFEYQTYATDAYYHDHHMGYIVDAATGSALNSLTRARRVQAQAYQARYLRNINTLRMHMERRGRSC